MAKQDFRFFDSRQKYLLFVTTTNEKQVIGDHLDTYIKTIKPKKNPTVSFVINILVIFKT